jgi:hypothetical protein
MDTNDQKEAYRALDHMYYSLHPVASVIIEWLHDG